MTRFDAEEVVFGSDASPEAGAAHPGGGEHDTAVDRPGADEGDTLLPGDESPETAESSALHFGPEVFPPPGEPGDVPEPDLAASSITGSSPQASKNDLQSRRGFSR